ncbi:MAG: NAD(P)-dependent oxidoreductase, partial [Terrimesophilobacter sp.]
MTSSGGSVQHRSVLGASAVELPQERQPRPGPLAVLPEPTDFFVSAIKEAGGTVAPLSQDTRGIVWLSYDRAHEMSDVLEGHPNLDWVQLPWAGVDAFADVMAKHSGARPVWTSAKGAYAEPVAEHALAMILSLLREFPRRVIARSWGPKVGASLYGANVVIVGAGGIAIELMRLLEPFRTTISIVRRSSSSLDGAAHTVTFDQLHDVLPTADVVVLAAALTSATAGLMGVPELALMKSSAVLVNVARGGLVDTDALVDALAS